MRYYLRNKKIKKRDNITLRRIFYLFIYIFLSNYHEISLEKHMLFISFPFLYDKLICIF
jgi:hypothetical protein